MTAVRVRGFQIFKDRHGKWRCYHRATRTAVNLDHAPLGSVQFFAECARVAALHMPALPAKPGTLGALIKAYRASAVFDELAPATRAGYQRVFDYLKAIDDTPLTRFTTPFVVKLMDRALETRKRHFANYVRTVLSLLFTWGKARGYVTDNPALGLKGIRRKKGTPKQNRRWTDAERHAVLDAAPPHMLPAIGLMMFTGLGPRDALTLPRDAYRNGVVETARSKTGVPVRWPAIEPLRVILAEAPRHGAATLCANSDGRTWTDSGFRASWRTLRVRLEAAGKVGAGLTLYGLRHTVAAILREAGVDLRTIADALGQKTEAMAQHYASEADLSPTMERVASTFERAVNLRRTSSVKPGGK